MQGVKSNTAPIRVEYRVCQQVVEIDEHSQQHNPPSPPPCTSEEQPCNAAGHKYVQKKVHFIYFEKVHQLRTIHDFDFESPFE